VYWRSPFKNLADVQELVEFIIMDIEPVGQSSGRFYLAEATIARASDLGVNDTTYFTRTHLGGILHPGDTAMGYHLTGTNFNNPNFEALEQSSVYSSTIPDVMLVKKHYPRKKKSKSRKWRLKRMNRDEERPTSSSRKHDQDRLEADYEMFLRDVEEDTELRSTLALYKSKQANKPKVQPDRMEGVEGDTTSNVDEDDDGDVSDGLPKINLDELLEDFEDLNVDD